MLVDGTPVGALRMRLLCVHGIPSEKRKPIVTFAQLHPVHAERMRDRTTNNERIIDSSRARTPPCAFDYRSKTESRFVSADTARCNLHLHLFGK